MELSDFFYEIIYILKNNLKFAIYFLRRGRFACRYVCPPFFGTCFETFEVAESTVWFFLAILCVSLSNCVVTFNLR